MYVSFWCCTILIIRTVVPFSWQVWKCGLKLVRLPFYCSTASSWEWYFSGISRCCCFSFGLYIMQSSISEVLNPSTIQSPAPSIRTLCSSPDWALHSATKGSNHHKSACKGYNRCVLTRLAFVGTTIEKVNEKYYLCPWGYIHVLLDMSSLTIPLTSAFQSFKLGCHCQFVQYISPTTQNPIIDVLSLY